MCMFVLVVGHSQAPPRPEAAHVTLHLGRCPGRRPVSKMRQFRIRSLQWSANSAKRLDEELPFMTVEDLKKLNKVSWPRVSLS